MKVKLKIEHTKTYLLACSYGPDSMHLFHLLLKKKANFVVCHVNYHKRPESNDEEKALREYCKKNSVLFEVLDTSKMKCDGNFQAWARKVRYDFFKKCYEKYNASALLVAHQQDDLIETYCIQNRRGGFFSNIGLVELSKVNNMVVYRPLLNLRKSDIQKYDDEKGIPYAIDSSNLKDDYERNRLRHHYVSQLSEEEREKLVSEIKSKNFELQSLKEKAKQLISSHNKVCVSDLSNTSIELLAQVIFLVLENENLSAPISTKQISKFKESLSSSKANIAVPLGNDVTYYQEYGEICIKKSRDLYSYKMSEPSILDVDEFYIDLTNGGEDRNIKEEDFPIYIRCPKENDVYKIKDYSSPINRLFIDWKMPVHLRKYWPVIENKNGDIIYIPRYRKNFKDEHKTPFKIKLN